MKIKCSNCKKTFEVSDKYLNETLKRIECPHCKKTKMYPHFGYCPKCKENVGCNQKLVNDFKKAFIEFGKQIPNIAYNRSPLYKLGFNNIKNAFKGYTGNLKMCHTFGYCSVCETPFLKCPYCGALVQARSTIGLYDSYYCTECYKEFVYG